MQDDTLWTPHDSTSLLTRCLQKRLLASSDCLTVVPIRTVIKRPMKRRMSRWMQAGLSLPLSCMYRAEIQRWQ